MSEANKYSAVVPVMTIAAARNPDDAPSGKVCCVCAKETTGDDPVVSGRSWHLDCFQCDLCNQPFQFGSYVTHNKYVLHKSCYAYLFSPRCFVCSGVLAGSSVIEALGHMYHAECFSCIRCRVQIPASATFNNIDGFPVCSDCFSKEEPICLKCGLIMHENFLRFLFAGRVYHMHKTCAACDECKAKLTEKNFTCEQNVAVCRNCWILALMRKCSACGNGILSKDLVQFHGDWHKKCFHCQMCHTALSYIKPVVIDKTLTCDRCANAIATHCGVCKKLITGDKISTHNRVFHHSCFRCSKCNKILSDDQFEFKRGELHCLDCMKK